MEIRFGRQSIKLILYIFRNFCFLVLTYYLVFKIVSNC